MKNEADRSKRYTNEEKRDLLRRWSESGQGAVEFGKVNGVGQSTLFKWRLIQEGRKAAAKSEVRFKPVRVVSPTAGERLEICAANGFVIKVGGAVNETLLAQVLRVVARCG